MTHESCGKCPPLYWTSSLTWALCSQQQLCPVTRRDAHCWFEKDSEKQFAKSFLAPVCTLGSVPYLQSWRWKRFQRCSESCLQRLPLLQHNGFHACSRTDTVSKVRYSVLTNSGHSLPKRWRKYPAVGVSRTSYPSSTQLDYGKWVSTSLCDFWVVFQRNYFCYLSNLRRKPP